MKSYVKIVSITAATYLQSGMTLLYGLGHDGKLYELQRSNVQDIDAKETAEPSFYWHQIKIVNGL